MIKKSRRSTAELIIIITDIYKLSNLMFNYSIASLTYSIEMLIFIINVNTVPIDLGVPIGRLSNDTNDIFAGKVCSHKMTPGWGLFINTYTVLC